jgi:hypothetical protein
VDDAKLVNDYSDRPDAETDLGKILGVPKPMPAEILRPAAQRM